MCCLSKPRTTSASTRKIFQHRPHWREMSSPKDHCLMIVAYHPPNKIRSLLAKHRLQVQDPSSLPKCALSTFQLQYWLWSSFRTTLLEITAALANRWIALPRPQIHCRTELQCRVRILLLVTSTLYSLIEVFIKNGITIITLGGGGGFRLKPQMKVSFVWMWPYRILDARAQKECSWRVVHVLLQISWLAGALRVIIAALATSRASTQTTCLRQVRGSIFSLLLVWFAGDMKSERPSKDDEQHCRCVVWEEKTVLQSPDVAFSAPSRKSSFLRVLLSCEGGRRLALFQEDSHVGRERESERSSHWQSENYHLWRDLRATECPTDKIGESWGMRLCHVSGDRPLQELHVCMRAYLRNLLGSAARCWPNPCCGTAFVQFFCSLFVNLLSLRANL